MGELLSQASDLLTQLSLGMALAGWDDEQPEQGDYAGQDDAGGIRTGGGCQDGDQGTQAHSPNFSGSQGSHGRLGSLCHKACFRLAVIGIDHALGFTTHPVDELLAGVVEPAPGWIPDDMFLMLAA